MFHFLSVNTDTAMEVVEVDAVSSPPARVEYVLRKNRSIKFFAEESERGGEYTTTIPPAGTVIVDLVSDLFVRADAFAEPPAASTSSVSSSSSSSLSTMLQPTDQQTGQAGDALALPSYSTALTASVQITQTSHVATTAADRPPQLQGASREAAPDTTAATAQDDFYVLRLAFQVRILLLLLGELLMRTFPIFRLSQTFADLFREKHGSGKCCDPSVLKKI